MPQTISDVFFVWLSGGRSADGTVNPSSDYGRSSLVLYGHEVFPLKLGSLKAAFRDVQRSLQSPECGPCLEYNGTPLGAELEKREGQPAETYACPWHFFVEGLSALAAPD